MSVFAAAAAALAFAGPLFAQQEQAEADADLVVETLREKGLMQP